MRILEKVLEVDILDWSKLPDLVAVALLVCAFASVARSSQTSISKLWLIGWVLIALHFAGFAFAGAPGIWGTLCATVGLESLVWAGLLFMWASVPYQKERSSHWMQWTLLCANTAYIAALAAQTPAWLLTCAAITLGAAPLAIALALLSEIKSLLRWTTVALYCGLATFLLAMQQRPGNGVTLALNAVLFTVYFSCAILFSHSFWRKTAGAFITTCGFFAWTAVFVLAPLKNAYAPQLHLESEVWNLPKYVVAAGMILLLLEDQIAHNKYLALHDELTGLPNRRLFQDRLASALARAHRTGTQAALMVVDLDHFKQVNDTLGHHAGDLVLQHVASAFSARVRRSDTVARTGGDEFSVILEETTSFADAENVAHSLMELLAEPISVHEHPLQVGASVGVAIFPDDAKDEESLCIVADLRMYENKHGSADGRQQFIRANDALLSVAGPPPETSPCAHAREQNS